jgi:hypothetical protein
VAEAIVIASDAERSPIDGARGALKQEYGR